MRESAAFALPKSPIMAIAVRVAHAASFVPMNGRRRPCDRRCRYCLPLPMVAGVFSEAQTGVIVDESRRKRPSEEPKRCDAVLRSAQNAGRSGKVRRPNLT
jgi:hypothetical protein